MSVSASLAFTRLCRSALRASVFAVSVLVAVFSVSSGYGLLTMLLRGVSGDTGIGVATLATHGGLTAAFFLCAGLGAYVAKKCYW